MDIKHILKHHAYQNIPLSFEEAYELGVYALAGCAGDKIAQIQSVAALTALHNQATYAWAGDKGATSKSLGHALPESAAEQIAGICAAVFNEDVAKSAFGYLHPNIPYAMDNCGMGGDLVVTANVSTIAAFIAAAAGIPMCKHGSPANADKGHHGSSDFVALLGIDTFSDKSRVQACVESEGFGYTEALDVRYKRIHLQTHKYAMLPHMNDIIGPITNPLSPHLLSRRILGVNHLIAPRVVAEAYHVLNRKGITHLRHGLFVRGLLSHDGFEGFDEVSICAGGTQIAELLEGEIREYRISAADFGIDFVPGEAISPPQGMSKGEFSMRILRGEIDGPPLMMVLANAALLFYLAGRSQNLSKCYAMAESIHSSGRAYEKMLTVQRLLSK